MNDLAPANGNSVRWQELVERIRARDGTAAEQLFAELSDLLRPMLRHAVDAQSVEDRLQEVLTIVAQAIRNGELRDPSRLTGFVFTVARRQMVAHIRSAMLYRRHFADEPLDEVSAPPDRSPEALTQQRERSERLTAALRKLRARDRQILTRFYLYEESADHICQAMQLTPTQFRLYKSRAIARCSELARRDSH
jgi:RNA polymerase sigma-70 factor (ECF subfamily)